MLSRDAKNSATCKPIDPQLTDSSSWVWYYRYARMQQYEYASNNKSSSGDEIPERDVTYHLIWLLIYHWTINRTTHLLPLLSNAYLLHIMDVDYTKKPLAQISYRRGCRRRQLTTVGVRKLGWLPFRVVSKYPQCIALCDHNSPTLQTDGRASCLLLVS